ncbi:hypothetical protein SVAN01_04049 [Stagonosporopsis vannaccii]|nr:hypothetical protein SVAN01_04049 [Stagonosporopsis vannaccii]
MSVVQELSYEHDIDTRKLRCTCRDTVVFLMRAGLTHCIRLVDMHEPFFVESRDKGSTPLCSMALGCLSTATYPLGSYVGEQAALGDAWDARV